MKNSNELIRIVIINEEIKHVNKLSRKIYMLGLNAMLMSRRAGGAETGYARVTRELRLFSENLENAMQQLTKMITQMTNEVSIDVKAKRHSRTFTEAIRQSGKRNGAVKLDIENRSKVNADVGYDSFRVVAHKFSHLRQLCRQGQNIAVLAKVEAMHINSESDILHNIGEEVSVVVEQVENSMLAACYSASHEGLAA